MGGAQGLGGPQFQEGGGDPEDDAGGLQQETQGVGDHQGRQASGGSGRREQVNCLLITVIQSNPDKRNPDE